MSDKTDKQLRNAEIADKLVTNFGTHEKVEIDDYSKEYELPESGSTDDFQFDKTEQFIYRFLEFGCTYVATDALLKNARAELVEQLEKDLNDGDLVLSSQVIADLN